MFCRSPSVGRIRSEREINSILERVYNPRIIDDIEFILGDQELLGECFRDDFTGLLPDPFAFILGVWG